jgi:long-subunit fatty acid transport protein
MPQLKGSVGYMYTNVGIDTDDMSTAAPELDAHTIAAGVAYEAMPGLNLNFGILKTYYHDETTSDDVKLKKDVIIVALGVQYKFW